MLKTRRKWFVLIATGIMIMLANLDMTITNVALARITAALHGTINQAQWVLTSYMLATVLFFTIFGKLADIIGRKKIFLLGIVLFTLGSVFAALSPNIQILFIARFIQGMGFAATLGLAFVIILSNFPENQRGTATGIAVSISGISQVIGPTIGGLIVQYLTWEWVFWINIPLGLLSLVMTYTITPTDAPDANKKSINLLSASTFVLGFGLILFAINQVNLLPSWLTTLLIVGGIVALVAFGLSARHSKAPLVDLHLLTHKSYLLVVLQRFLFMMLFSGALFTIPLYLQNILSFSPRTTGFIMLAMTGFVAIVSPITGKIMDHYGFARPLVTSMLLALVAGIISLFVSQSGAWLPIICLLVSLGIALGLHVPSSIAGVNQSASGTNAGTAMGLFFTMAIFGATIGVALAGAILGSVSKLYLVAKVSAAQLTADLYHAASGARSVDTAPTTLQPIVKQAFMTALHDYFLVMTVLMACGACIALYFARYRRVK